MKKYIFGAVLSLGILVSPAFTQAAGLTGSQIQAILAILSSFGVDQSVINNVSAALNGGTHQQSSTQTTQQQSSTQSTQQQSTQSTQTQQQSTQSTQTTQSTQQQSGGQCTFGKLYASPYADVGSSIASTPDGGYILGGSTNLRNTGGQYYDILLSKLDANGAINWQKTYGNKTSFSRIGEIGNGEKKSALFHAVPTPDGGYLAATNISNTTFDNGNPPLITGGMGEDILLVKTGASGVVQWQKSYGRQDNGKNYQYPLALQRVSGGYVIAGQTWKDNFQSAATDSFWSTFLMKVDDQGNVVWQKRAGTQEGATFGSLAQTSDGGYLMGITSEMMTSSSQWPVGGAVIFKFDSSGNTQWTKTYTNTGGINLNGAGAMTVSSTADGGSIVSETITVSHTATDWTTQDIFLFKLDASGALQWSKMYGTPGGYEYFNAVKQTPDGGYAVLGNNRDDILFLKLNSSGDIAWQKAYSSGPVWSSVGEELPADFTITSDGGYAIVGQTDRYKITGFEKSGNESDIIAFKVDASGNIAFSASGWSAKDTNLTTSPASLPTPPDRGGVGVVNSFDLSPSSFSANASDATLSEKDLSQGTCGATPTPTITVLSPNGGEVWHSGETHRVSWTPNVVNNVNIYIYDSNVSGSGSTNYITPNGNAVSGLSGYYDWVIPPLNQLPPFNGNGSTNYKISINNTDTNQSVLDSSDAPFSIVAPSGIPSITVLSPNGGEQFALGSKQYIKWSTQNFGTSNVRINLQKNDVWFRELFDSIPNDGIATWTVPADLAPGNDYKIIIRKYDDLSNVYDKSDAPFSVTTTSSSPDLIISVPPSLNSGTLVAGNTLTFKATVKNHGTADATGTFNNRFRIDMSNDGVIDVSTTDPDLTPYPTITNLAVGASQQVVSSYWTAVAGTHRLYSCADRPPPPPGAIAESDETNNCAWGDTFTVGNVLGASIGAMNSVSQSTDNFTYVWNRDLQIGSPYSDDITALQKALTLNGEYAGELTGGFYNQTYAAVKAFQEKYGIPATGYVGSLTRAELNTLFAR